MLESTLKYFSEVFKAVGVALFVYTYFAATFNDDGFLAHKTAYYFTFVMGLTLVLLGGFLNALAVKLSVNVTGKARGLHRQTKVKRRSL